MFCSWVSMPCQSEDHHSWEGREMGVAFFHSIWCTVLRGSQEGSFFYEISKSAFYFLLGLWALHLPEDIKYRLECGLCWTAQKRHEETSHQKEKLWHLMLACLKVQLSVFNIAKVISHIISLVAQDILLILWCWQFRHLMQGIFCSHSIIHNSITWTQREG